MMASGNILVTSNGWSFDAGQLSLAISDYLTLSSSSGLDAIFGTVSYSAVGNFMTNYDFGNNSVNFGGDTFISGTGNDIFNGLTNAHGDYVYGDTVDYSHVPPGLGKCWRDGESRNIWTAGYSSGWHRHTDQYREPSRLGR